MGYINKITIGGESYSLAPEVMVDTSLKRRDGGVVYIYMHPLGVSNTGGIYLNLSRMTSPVLYGVWDSVSAKYVPGLGVDDNGAIFPYFIYSNGSDDTVVSHLAALKHVAGALGVYCECEHKTSLLGTSVHNFLRKTAYGALYVPLNPNYLPPYVMAFDWETETQVASRLGIGCDAGGMYLYTVAL